jgi:simple sugar transport system permease protein
MAQVTKTTVLGWALVGLGVLCAVAGISEIPDLTRVLRLIPQAAANPGWLVLGGVIAAIGAILIRGKSTALLWPMAALALLLAYNLFFSRTFFDVKVNFINGQAQFYGSLIDVLKWGSRVMLLALGMTLVIATGGIDLSVGTVIAIAGCVAGSFIKPEAKSLFINIHIANMPFLIIGLALLTGLIAGAWNGTLVSFFKIQPIIATLILMIAGRGIAQLITGGAKPTYDPYPVMDFIGKGFLGGFPFQVVIVLCAAGFTLLLTRASALGLFIESIGNNAPAAELAGINARWVKFLVYAFTGVCAATAGLMQTAELRYPDYNAGMYSELDAIVAVAIGGTSLVGGRFSILGSLLGAFIMQALRTTILSNSDNPPLNLVIQASVVLVICLLQSELLRSLVARAWRRVFPGHRAAAGVGAEGLK